MEITLEILFERTFANGTDLRRAIENEINFKQQIKKLSKIYLGREVTGCSNCIEDAYHSLRKIWKMGTKPSKYRLRNGALLRDNDPTKLCTQANITDELAEYHLLKNPACAIYFVDLPKDWKQNIGKSETKKEAKRKFTNEELAIISEIRQSLLAGADKDFLLESYVELGYSEADVKVFLKEANK